MAGLLDTLGSDEVLGGLLSAGAASGAKGNFLSRMAQGLQAGDRFSQGRREEARQRSQDEMRAEYQKLMQMKMQRDEQQAAAAQAQQGANTDAVRNSLTNFDPAQFLQQNPKADIAGLEQAVKLKGLMTPKVQSPISVAPGAALLDPTSFKPLFQNPKEDSVPSAIKEYQFAKDQGYAGSYQQWTMDNKKAGATNVNNSVSVAGPENKYNQDVGAGLAKSALGSIETAQGAAGVVQNAQMIRNALRDGAITGTGAEARLAIQKALETAGVVGEGKAANSQALMAGLGKITLTSIRSSGLGAGQGFTDKDREFLQRASSGTIEDTPANLLRVADLSDRVARLNHKKGNEILARWRANPSLGPVSQDTSIDPLPEAAKPAPAKSMPTLPPAQAHKGRTIRDTTTGKMLQSNGMSWVEIK